MGGKLNDYFSNEYYSKGIMIFYIIYKVFFFFFFFVNASYYLYTEKIDYHDTNSKNILNYVFIYFVYVRQWFLLIFDFLKIKELDGILDALWTQKVE